MQIRIAKEKELDKLWSIYQEAKKHLEEQNIFQWTDDYPSYELIKSDLKNQYVYIGVLDKEIIGAVNISEEQEKEYASIDWQNKYGKALVVHRLVVSPTHQGKGYASQLMDFSEKLGANNGFTSVRLDTYSQNEFNLQFYRNRKYTVQGQVYFPKREFHFWCLEKTIKKN